ncbi:RNA polymerase subunit sigma-70 [Nocardia sp. NPDC059180]|uniref:RNA polymerase subunit sigma-70 n=1 Tax=Nocardia sp. NPDC059180 TaxID=3346761 RepID=UPI00367CFCFC
MEPTVLERARAGDERAFGELTDPYRRELLVHCYRMLGSLTDAEDTLQETLFAAWRGLPEFEQRSSLRTWLYRIATNRCLNVLRSARRRPPEPVPPFRPPEPTRRDSITWLQPAPDDVLAGVADPAAGPEADHQARATVELTFVAALQRLPPLHTATVVLRDVLDFPTAQVADLLDSTPTVVKGTLQRARATLHREHGSIDVTRPGSATEQALAQRFAAAYLAGDVDGVVALLTDDSWLTMPPAPHEYHGPDAIAAFLHASFGYRGTRRAHLTATSANTQPAFASYLDDQEEPSASPAGLIVLTCAGERIAAITRFHLDTLYARFGMPDRLPVPAENGR